MRSLYFYITLFFVCSFLKAQNEDSIILRNIYDEVLTNGQCYENLHSLCKDIGHRLSGSQNAADAVIWGKEVMEKIELENVRLQEMMVPHWVRGSLEKATIVESYMIGTKPLDIKALGGSVGTPREGIIAEVIMVNNFEDLEKIGEDQIRNKIVFFNRPMDPKLLNTFEAYGGCVNQRWGGAMEAAKYGAVAVLVRSMTHKTDNHAHTGSMSYGEFGAQIPAAAVSIDDANALELVLTKEKKCTVNLKMSCKRMPDVLSHNVIGEIVGSEFPDSIIVVGGHLDSWDVGEGAHDDGAGVVHSLEALRLLKAIGYKPRFTIRCVLFMNEENGNRGGLKYAEDVKKDEEYQYFAIESDRGGFVPRGFSMDATLSQDLEQLQSWSKLFEPYGIHLLEKGYAGVDIGPLKEVQDTITMCGFIPDSQRYFDHHHAESDVFESVNKRELELGAASIASLIYLVDKHGWDSRK